MIVATQEQARELIREVVQHKRQAGAEQIGLALAAAARALGLKFRRVKALYYGERIVWRAEDAITLAERFEHHLKNEEQRLMARQALLAARRHALRQ